MLHGIGKHSDAYIWFDVTKNISKYMYFLQGSILPDQGILISKFSWRDFCYFSSIATWSKNLLEINEMIGLDLLAD